MRALEQRKTATCVWQCRTARDHPAILIIHRSKGDCSFLWHFPTKFPANNHAEKVAKTINIHCRERVRWWSSENSCNPSSGSTHRWSLCAPHSQTGTRTGVVRLSYAKEQRALNSLSEEDILWVTALSRVGAPAGEKQVANMQPVETKFAQFEAALGFFQVMFSKVFVSTLASVSRSQVRDES